MLRKTTIIKQQIPSSNMMNLSFLSVHRYEKFLSLPHAPIDNSNMHTFYQPHDSKYRWTKDPPLEQVRGNPSKPVQTRRQLAIDLEMCMFALTVSTAEPKNIKEAMGDSTWIEAIQEELHQFDRLQVWELVHKPFGKTIIKLKWLWKNKKDEDQTAICNKAQFEEVYVAQPDGFVDLDHPEKVYCPRKALYVLKQAPRAWYDELLNFMMSKGFTKGTIDPTLFTIRYEDDILLVQIYVNDIIFGSTNPKYSKRTSMATPMATKPKLDANLSRKLVDQTNYHSMIGLLMYLTSSRPDIVQAGTINMGLCTSGGIQFLGDKLVSWMSKKQDCTAMSSAEVEYVTLSASCAQVMWMQT
ncbi:retrovirus-related pol polyprotein from transposon TNT 1-94 [Tanacetum coccineum]